MHPLFEYYPTVTSEYKLRSLAAAAGIMFQSAVKMRLRFAIEAADWSVEFFPEYYWRWFDEMLSLKRMLDRVDRPMRQGISDDDIATARNRDIRDVVDFNRGKASAWCHEDKNPSLTYMNKTNKAWCPVCGKYFDSIAVLMERDGMTFVKAVEDLCR